MKSHLAGFAAALALSIAGAASANTQVVYLSGAFADGGSYNGSFDVDTSSDTITDWNISTLTKSGGVYATYQSGVDYNAVLYFTNSGHDTFLQFWDRGALAPNMGYLATLDFVFTDSGTGIGEPAEVIGTGWAQLSATGAFVYFGETGYRFGTGPYPDLPSGIEPAALPPPPPPPTPGVPEPSTWALAILGLGLIGMAVRRRQSAEAPLFA